MSNSNDDGITIKMTGQFARQIREMQQKLGAKSEMEVIRQGLTLLYYAIGKEIKIHKEGSKESLVFDQFKNTKP
jgi:Arc/MetJ-type ribon-helix-helix transcriptional regulator